MEDCAKPGLCEKDDRRDVSVSGARCVGDRDADVDPVESQALTWLNGSSGPSHSPALFIRTPSFIGTSLVPNSETGSSTVLSLVLNRERGVTGGRVG